MFLSRTHPFHSPYGSASDDDIRIRRRVASRGHGRARTRAPNGPMAQRASVHLCKSTGWGPRQRCSLAAHGSARTDAVACRAA